jgi:hypothetical protein
LARHHFVPAFILRNFTSPEAWRLVKGPRYLKKKVAKHDQMVLDRSNPRKWPLCVLDKETGTFERRKLSDVCSRTNFYSLPDYDEPIMRGIVRHNIRSFDDPNKFTALSDEELIELGHQPLETNEIERVQVSAIDGSFSSLVTPIRLGEHLSETELNLVYRFITLARYRSPVWREIYYPEVYANVQRQLGRIRQTAENAGWKAPNIKSESSFDKELERNLYQIAIVQACVRELSALERIEAKILVLHAEGSSQFITTDNLARPYFPKRVKGLPSQNLPGIADPDSRLLYPISPDTCLVLTKAAGLPQFSHDEIKGTQIKEINSALALMAIKEIILPSPSLYYFLPWLNLNTMSTMVRP